MKRKAHWRRWLAGIGGLVMLSIILSMSQTACSLVGIRTWEEHAWRQERAEGRFSVRGYEPVIVAATTIDAGTPQPGNEAFSRLGGYIFGKNMERTKIAMTMPVVQEPAGRKIAMTMPVTQAPAAVGGYEFVFVMPAKYDLAALPQPTDKRVRLEQRPGELVGIYRFSGYADAADLQRHAPTLIKWLVDAGYETTGPARLAYYDPPWTIGFLRRNEVQVPVRRLAVPADGGE